MTTFRNVALWALVFLATSRGLLEAILPSKLWAIVLQAIFSFFCLIKLRLFENLDVQKPKNLMLVLSILLACLVSILYSYNPLYPYLGFILFIVVSSQKISGWEQRELVVAVKVIGGLSILIAYLQIYFGWNLSLSGVSWFSNGDVRPSGLSGSYLHYPVLTYISALILYCGGYYFSAFIFALSLLFLKSKAALLLTAILCIGVVLKLVSVLSREQVYKFGIVLLLGLAVYCYVERDLLSEFSLSSPGNIARLNAWEAFMSSLSPENIFFSRTFGYASNASQILDGDALIFESFLFNATKNIGLIGALLIYIQLFKGFNLGKNRDQIIQFGVLGIFLFSLVYQAFESLGILLMLSILRSSINNKRVA